MKKKKYRRLNTDITQVTVFRYTYDAWKRCFPESTYTEWEKTTFPDDLIEFELNVLEYAENQISNHSKLEFRVITINESYFMWLNENGLENSSENRFLYTEQISQKEALSLLRAEHMQYSNKIFFLNVIIILKEEGKSSYKLSKETCDKLKEYLTSVYQNVDIFIPGYILKSDVAIDNIDKIMLLAKCYFEENQRVQIQAFDEQQYPKNVNVASLYIPIILREEIIQADFSEDILYGTEEQPNIWRFPDVLTLNTDGFKKWNIQGVEDFDKTLVYQELEHIFQSDLVLITSNLISPNEIMDMELEIEKTFRKMGAKII